MLLFRAVGCKKRMPERGEENWRKKGGKGEENGGKMRAKSRQKGIQKGDKKIEEK